MKANSRMVALLVEVLREKMGALAQSLVDLSRSTTMQASGAVLLGRLKVGNLADFEDICSLEAHANKIHIRDYIATGETDELLYQGILFSEALAVQLRQHGIPFRVLLSRDPDADEVTVRFFSERGGVEWLEPDLDKYGDEELLLWEVE